MPAILPPQPMLTGHFTVFRRIHNHCVVRAGVLLQTHEQVADDHWAHHNESITVTYSQDEAMVHAGIKVIATILKQTFASVAS